MNYYVQRMGPALQQEVEKQLVEDLKQYGITETNASFDYSDACQEGHTTNYLNGELENLSSIVVRNANGIVIADGWMDFIHDGESSPLYVFWLFLDLIETDGKRIEVKKENDIPAHVWVRLPDKTKNLYIKAGIKVAQ